jgi:hypothetical protein
MEAGVRRLLLIVALVAVALTFSVLPTSFATAHGPHVSKHRASVGVPRPDDHPVVGQSPDSVERPSDDLLIGEPAATVAVTVTIEVARRARATRAPPARQHLAPVERTVLQVWRV